MHMPSEILPDDLPLLPKDRSSRFQRHRVPHLSCDMWKTRVPKISKNDGPLFLNPFSQTLVVFWGLSVGFTHCGLNHLPNKWWCVEWAGGGPWSFWNLASSATNEWDESWKHRDPFGDKSPCRAAITTWGPLRVAPNEPNGWLPLRPLQSWGVAAAEVAVRKAKRGMLGTGTMNSGGMKLNDQNWNEKVYKSPNLYGNACCPNQMPFKKRHSIWFKYIYISLIFELLTPPNLIKFAYPAEFLSCSDWLLAHRRAHSEGPLPNPVDSCTRLY